MGTLSYDSTLRADFEDRLLAHLQIVITAKLRRGESFVFSWTDSPSIGDGRTAIWLHPTVPLIYKYFGHKQPEINRRWIESLSLTANSMNGLLIVAEPREGAAAESTATATRGLSLVHRQT